MGVYLRDVPIGPTREDVVQVATIYELTLVPMKARDVNDDQCDQRPAKPTGIDVVHQIVDDPNAVQLVAMNGRSEPKHRTILFPSGDEQREKYVLRQTVGDQIDVEARQLSTREIFDDQLGASVNGVDAPVAEIAFHPVEGEQ